MVGLQVELPGRRPLTRVIRSGVTYAQLYTYALHVIMCSVVLVSFVALLACVVLVSFVALLACVVLVSFVALLSYVVLVSFVALLAYVVLVSFVALLAYVVLVLLCCIFLINTQYVAPSSALS